MIVDHAPGTREHTSSLSAGEGRKEKTMRKLAIGVAAAATLLAAIPASAQYVQYGVGPWGPSIYASPGYPYYYSGYPYYYGPTYAQPYYYYDDGYYYRY
jgi:hypothetical protein